MKLLLLTVTFFISVSSFGQTVQSYTAFDKTTLSLYAWQGNKIVLLSQSNALNPTTMNQWVATMDAAYNFYWLCTGREPQFYTGVTYLNNRSTIAQVPSTCGAGCGYLGWTGIEMENSYFNSMYNYINSQSLYNQIPFYELGRNFWFYSNQLEYKANDPIVTGYAVFMRFMAMEAAHVQGAPFNSWSFSEFKNKVVNLLPTYLADLSLNWNNTLGIGEGVPNSNLGATDLFASFCFYLRDHYCGNHWVENVWKFAGQRPTAVTTQDAVDNFIIASSQAANTNLTSLFQSWKFPISNPAISYLTSLNLGRINSQPSNTSVSEGENAQFSISSSDQSATFQWQIDAGSGFESLTDNPYFSGSTTKYLTVLNTSLNMNQSYFRCLVTIGNCTDTSSTAVLSVNQVTAIKDHLTTKRDHITIYPNPTNGQIHFSSPITIQMINITGQIVAEKSHVSSLDISHLPSGVYFVTIKSNEGKVVQQNKLVIKK